MKRYILPLILLATVFSGAAFSQRYLGYRATDSGGALIYEQAAYDITFYDINLKINPKEKSISGWTQIEAHVTSPIEWFVLDLDSRLAVTQVDIADSSGNYTPCPFERRENQIWCQVIPARQPDEHVSLRVYYGGQPKEAPAPPWVGGFTWSQTADGHPWIATSMQFDGADLWVPCKDHPSDEPDSVGINITIPQPLMLASNGVLRSVSDNEDGTRTFRWFHSNPINNYNIALNIAPYRTLETKYTSTSGDVFPVIFFALPEQIEQARGVFPQFTKHLRFYEELLGPYPFRADKYSVAYTPHLGMEHQTVIAFGRIEDNEWGFDELHHHELGHEWWGNLVTAFDWRDFWLHEGFCSYMQALYTEELHGENAYREFIAAIQPKIRNITTLAPRHTETVVQRYFVAPEFIESDGDIYTKGALVLHTLRFLIGKETLLESLRRFAYPDPAMESITDGRQCRFATTDDFMTLTEEISGMELDWFFEVYVRQPVLPNLIAEENQGMLQLRWETPDDLPFPMPVEVLIAGKKRRVEMTDGQARVDLPANADYEIDPEKKVYKRETE